MTRFSRRSAYAADRNALSLALGARRARGERVIDLTTSNPTTAGLHYDDHAIAAALANVAAMTYEPAALGLPQTRELIARYTQVDASRIVITASTSEAYAFLFKALCDPGDHVLIPAPSYPLFDQLAGIEGVTLAPYRLAYDGAWHIDTPSIAKATSDRTRAIVAVSPNNPTGNVLTRGELAAMQAAKLPIISDEVFAEYTFSSAADSVFCAAREAGESLVFSLGGLSKLAGLPQMKLGWIALGGPDALVAEAIDRLEWIADAFLSVAAPVQHALPALLASGAVTRASISSRLARNLAALRATLSGSPATVLSVEAGWYAMVRMPNTRTEEAWAMALLELGVYVHPGHFFDMESEPYLVLSLLTPEADWQQGARVIGELSRT